MPETVGTTSIALGTMLADFTLPDTRSNQEYTLSSYAEARAIVVMFLANHCPYVKLILPKLLEVVVHYQEQGVAFVGISANDPTAYPDDSPAAMQALARELNFTFPYLYDATQAVAKAYDAVCTPDFYVLSPSLALLYHGRFDGATPGNGQQVSGVDLCQALDAILTPNARIARQIPSLGCNIKWRLA